MSITKKKQKVHGLVLRLDVDETDVVFTMFHEDEFGDRVEGEEEKIYRYKYKNAESRKENIKNCMILITDIRQADKNGKEAIYIPKTASELRHYIKNRTLIINQLYLHDKDRKETITEYKDAELPDASELLTDGVSISWKHQDENDNDDDDEKGNDIDKERQNYEQDLSKQIQHVKQRKKELHHSHHHNKEKEYMKTF